MTAWKSQRRVCPEEMAGLKILAQGQKKAGLRTDLYYLG
jgi:hypothetical protein